MLMAPLTTVSPPMPFKPYNLDQWLKCLTQLRWQTNGKIIVAGTVFGETGGDFGLARFNTNGTPDSSFGGDGTVTTVISSGFDYAYAVAIDITGKILTAGSSSTPLHNMQLHGILLVVYWTVVLMGMA